jgi:hypothetical protein
MPSSAACNCSSCRGARSCGVRAAPRSLHALLGLISRYLAIEITGRADKGQASRTRPANGGMGGALGQSEARLMETCCLLALPALCLCLCLCLLCSGRVQFQMPRDPKPFPECNNTWMHRSRGEDRVQPQRSRLCTPPCLLPFAGTWCLTIAMLPLAPSDAVSASSQHPASTQPASNQPYLGHASAI